MLQMSFIEEESKERDIEFFIEWMKKEEGDSHHKQGGARKRSNGGRTTQIKRDQVKQAMRQIK